MLKRKEAKHIQNKKVWGIQFEVFSQIKICF